MYFSKILLKIIFFLQQFLLFGYLFTIIISFYERNKFSSFFCYFTLICTKSSNFQLHLREVNLQKKWETAFCHFLIIIKVVQMTCRLEKVMFVINFRYLARFGRKIFRDDVSVFEILPGLGRILHDDQLKWAVIISFISLTSLYRTNVYFIVPSITQNCLPHLSINFWFLNIRVLSVGLVVFVRY